MSGGVDDGTNIDGAAHRDKPTGRRRTTRAFPPPRAARAAERDDGRATERSARAVPVVAAYSMKRKEKKNGITVFIFVSQKTRRLI